MIIVNFVHGWHSYKKGDIAGFKDEEAYQLRDKKLVVFLNQDIKTAPPVKLPPYEKVSNLCALCGFVGKSAEELKEHKRDIHGI